jgi:hypothetical protein
MKARIPIPRFFTPNTVTEHDHRRRENANNRWLLRQIGGFGAKSPMIAIRASNPVLYERR